MKFEGREPSLKRFIYDSTEEQSPDQYIKTTKEIINYLGPTYTKYTAEFTQAVRDLQLMVPTPPTDTDPTNMIAFEMWKVEVKEYRVKEQEYFQLLSQSLQHHPWSVHQGATGQA
jgi:hypothetical protein